MPQRRSPALASRFRLLAKTHIDRPLNDGGKLGNTMNPSLLLTCFLGLLPLVECTFLRWRRDDHSEWIMPRETNFPKAMTQSYIMVSPSPAPTAAPGSSEIGTQLVKRQATDQTCAYISGIAVEGGTHESLLHVLR
jgi:hypothetical protein